MSQDLQVINESIVLKSKRDVLHLHLYTMLKKDNIQATSTELDVLIELYEFGGFANKDKKTEFFDVCISKQYRTTTQSVRNVLSKFTKNGVLDKPKANHRNLKEKYLPVTSTQLVGLKYTIINAS